MKTKQVLQFGFIPIFLLFFLGSHGQERHPLLLKYDAFKERISFGVGGNIVYSTTWNISEEQLEPYGFSGDSFTVHPTIEYAAFGLVQYQISPLFDVQVGLGYSKQSEDITIYPSTFIFFPIKDEDRQKHLKIDISYYHIPVHFNFLMFKRNEQQVWLTAGVSSKFSISGKNNFSNLTYEKIGISYSYGYFNLVTDLAITHRFNLLNNQVDLSLFGSFNNTPLIEIGYGFLANMRDAKNLQLGVQMKYFFYKPSKN